jgi:hypothetical protein
MSSRRWSVKCWSVGEESKKYTYPILAPKITVFLLKILPGFAKNDHKTVFQEKAHSWPEIGEIGVKSHHDEDPW